MFPSGLPALLCVPGFQALRLRTRGRAGSRPAPTRGQVAVGGESRHDARPQGTCRSRRLWGADRGHPEGPVIVHSQGAWPTLVCGRSGPRVWLSEGTGTARGSRGPLQTRGARPRPQFLIRAGRCFGLRVRSRGETGRKAGDHTRDRELRRRVTGPGTGRAPLTRAAVREGAVKEVAAARPRLHGPAVRSPCVHGRVSRRPGPRGPA